MKAEWEKIIKFACVSGIGWLTDSIIYLCLIVRDITPLLSNCISASIAVTFVYILSVRNIFLIEDKFIASGFVIYLVYQIISIGFFSWLIDIISYSVSSSFDYFKISIPLAVKIILTPFTLASNYLFMRFLTSRILSKTLI